MLSRMIQFAFLFGAASAVPSKHPAKRQSTQSEDATTVGNSDVSILNYALTLEHIEDAFYQGGLLNFTEAQFATAGFDSSFYNNLKEVAADESTHVQFLTAALESVGATPVSACTYDFPYTDPSSFVALASILEGVGVSAYLGAAADIANPDYLTVAASILTVEARHSSYVRANLGEAPFPEPFDTPLDFNQVYTLASQFIVSCPDSNPLIAAGVKAFPPLAISPNTILTPNATVTLSTPGYVLLDPSTGSTGGQLFAAFVGSGPSGPSTVFVPTNPVALSDPVDEDSNGDNSSGDNAGGNSGEGEDAWRKRDTAGGGYVAVVPEGLSWQVYVLLTACNERVTDDTVAAGPAVIEITD